MTKFGGSSRHLGPWSWAGAGDHLGIPEIWGVGMCEDAQAGAGEPGKGCPSVLGHFQG